MYVFLFNLAGLAIFAWLLLIVLPAWKVTRWIAETAVFPVFLSAVYVLGIVPLLMRTGPGIMGDFGSAEGVTRLLANPDIALIAWIHILAFDQLVGLMIYRENMQHRYVPLPVQSVLLLGTLMFGPVGFLTYYVLRAWSRGRRAAREVPAETVPSVGRVPAAGGVGLAMRTAAAGALGVLRRERALTATALLGIALGMGCAVGIAVRGAELVGAEGHLRKAATFDVAVGMYLLTLVMLLPLARFSRWGLMAWRVTLVGLTLFAFGMENVQVWRGIDPRFTRVGSATDQMLGGFFFLSAMGMIATFAILAWKLLARRMDGADGPLLLALRYAGVATFGAFGAGFWMSAVGGLARGRGGEHPAPARPGLPRAAGAAAGSHPAGLGGRGRGPRAAVDPRGGRGVGGRLRRRRLADGPRPRAPGAVGRQRDRGGRAGGVGRRGRARLPRVAARRSGRAGGRPAGDGVGAGGRTGWCRGGGPRAAPPPLAQARTSPKNPGGG